MGSFYGSGLYPVIHFTKLMFKFRKVPTFDNSAFNLLQTDSLFGPLECYARSAQNYLKVVRYNKGQKWVISHLMLIMFHTTTVSHKRWNHCLLYHTSFKDQDTVDQQYLATFSNWFMYREHCTGTHYSLAYMSKRHTLV